MSDLLALEPRENSKGLVMFTGIERSQRSNLTAEQKERRFEGCYCIATHPTLFIKEPLPTSDSRSGI
jgi:hypothetical protein